MVTGGSLSGTTLDGGLLQVFSSFDAADLTLTSGTLELGGGSLTAGSGGPIALTANTSLTGFGTVTADINLNGGSVDGLVDPFLARNGIEFISDVRGSGTLTDVTLFKLLDVGSGGGAVSLIDGTLAAGSSVLLDIAGTANGQYDTFSANLASDLTGGDLVVAFTAGFTPSPGDSWTLFSGGFDPATFASITLPSNTELRGYQLHAVPEPTSFCLMCCAAGVLFRRLRSRGRPTDQSSSRTPARSLSPFVLRGGSWLSLRGKL